MPTEQQLNNFWNNLQRVLTDADARIDLKSKADLARFRIITVESVDPESESFFEAEVSGKFAFIDDPNFDFNKATDEEFINAMNNEKPTPEKMTELYNMAKEGRLFFNSLPETRQKVRQVFVDADGNPSVGPDFDHPTPEMLTATETPIKPPKPKYKSAGFGTRVRAFFGNEEAKKKCEAIDWSNKETEKKYKERLAKWKAIRKMDKTFVRRCQNQMYACATYFEAAANDEVYDRESRIMNVTLRAHLKDVTDGLSAMARDSADVSAKQLVELINKDPAMTPEKELLIADICYQNSMGSRLEHLVKGANVSEVGCTEMAKKMTKGSPEYREQIGEITRNPKFRNAIAEFTPDDLKAIAANPGAAEKAVYRKCLGSLVEQPKHPTVEPAQKTAQKAATMDDAAVRPASAPHL